MTDKMKKLNDEALENVTGGARRTVSNDLLLGKIRPGQAVR